MCYSRLPWGTRQGRGATLAGRKTEDAMHEYLQRTASVELNINACLLALAIHVVLTTTLRNILTTLPTLAQSAPLAP